MRRKIRRSIHIVVTESWTVAWEDDGASPPGPKTAGDGSHVITWEDGEDPPAAVILRRQADGSGWRVEAEKKML